MFIQEMHYMTQKIAEAVTADDTELFEDFSERLKIYELRALTLFKDLDLSQIGDSDNNADQQFSVTPSTSSFEIVL